MRKLILILIISISTISLMAQAEEDSLNKKHFFCADIFTGINYTISGGNTSTIHSDGLPFSFFPRKIRLMYASKKWSTGLGWSQKLYSPGNIFYPFQKFNDIENKVSSLFAVFEYYFIAKKRVKLGIYTESGVSGSPNRYGYGAAVDEFIINSGLTGEYKVNNQLGVIFNIGYEYVFNGYESFFNNSSLSAYLGLSSRFNKQSRINYFCNDSLTKYKYGIQFGFSYNLYSKTKTIFNPSLDPSFSPVMSQNKQEEYIGSYKNAFAHLYGAFPVLEFNVFTKKLNNHAIGIGYRQSIHDQEQSNIIASSDKQLIDFKIYYKYDRPICNKCIAEKEHPAAYPYWGIKLMFNYKEMMYNYHRFIGIVSFNGNFLYKEYSSSGFILLPLGFRLNAGNLWFDIGTNINIFGFLTGYYHYSLSYTDIVSYSASDNGNYSKALFAIPDFSGDIFLIRDLSLKIGYTFKERNKF